MALQRTQGGEERGWSTVWREPSKVPKSPASYDSVTDLKALAAKTKDLLVDIDWRLTTDELKSLRWAVYQWQRPVVKQFKRFDIEVIRAINRVVKPQPGFFKVKPPGGSEHRDSGAEVRPDGDSWRLVAWASFSVIFGYGLSAQFALHPRTKDHEACKKWLGEELALKIRDSVANLGWSLERLAEPPFEPVRREIYNLAKSKGPV